MPSYPQTLRDNTQRTGIMVRTFLSDVDTPVSLFHKICQNEPTAFLLESTEGNSRLARFSFIGFDPVKTISFKDGRAMIHHHQASANANVPNMVPIENPLDVLQKEMMDFPRQEMEQVAAELDIPFLGGWVGYMGYGATRYFENITPQKNNPHHIPEGLYGLYDTVLLYDHLNRTVTFLSSRGENQAEALLHEVMQRIMDNHSLPPLPYHPDWVDESKLFDTVLSPWNPEEYCKGVVRCKEWIQAGEVFQIVLANRYSLPTKATPLNIYRTIQSVNPSPYAYFLKFPDFVYLGSSPETFVSCQHDQVVLRALAGTRPRGGSLEEDEALAQELKDDTKEMAEHRMLVDLARNDLGRVCKVNSVEVGEIATLTKYTHVMHLATEVSGTLKSDVSAYNVFQSCFPRGTVSGAPKIRAMELLSQLEPEQRGVYSGAVGYFDCFGNMDAAIAIRSTLIKDGVAHVHAGAGIVYDSDPLSEYHETRNKAKSILKAIQLAERMERHAPHSHR